MSQILYQMPYMQLLVANRAAEIANEQMRAEFLTGDGKLAQHIEGMAGSALEVLKKEWDPIVAQSLEQDKTIALMIQPQYAILLDFEDKPRIESIVTQAVKKAAIEEAQSFVGSILHDLIQ